MWNIFERRVCLTLFGEEWPQAQEEFARVGLSVEAFQALPDIGPHQSFNNSVNRILRDFLESGAQTLLHTEDDCVFRDLEHLPAALSSLQADWDIVYLGANLLDDQPERVADHLFRVRAAWTTHCVGYSRKVVPFLVENQPDASATMFDTWLSTELSNLKAYVVAPMVAYQRPKVSSIWGRYDDYTPLFEASDAKLR